MKKTKLKYNANPVGIAVLGDPKKGETKFIANPVGAGLVPAQNEKGITLIALIITIIVMLILVGVTINVALNGGLFEKAKKASYQTEASVVKEQLEIAKAVGIANNNGNLLSDYSGITVDNTELEDKIKNKYSGVIILNADGEVCYNPDKVNEQEKDWLEEIGIKPATSSNKSCKFTLGEFADIATIKDGTFQATKLSLLAIIPEEFINGKSPQPFTEGVKIYNITCNDRTIPNASSENPETDFGRGYAMFDMGDEIWLCIKLGEGNENFVNDSNLEQYKELEFTITK